MARAVSRKRTRNIRRPRTYTARRGRKVQKPPVRIRVIKREQKTVRRSNPESPLSKFMSGELPRVKSANPGISDKDAYRLAYSRWTRHPSNPRNK
jgi:hypothetical protein